jgi:diguanylate cyclase (GGDEF)-like protein
MAQPTTLRRRLHGVRMDGPLRWIRMAGAWPGRARSSRYLVAGAAPRFRASQRRRTRTAARAGSVVIAAAVAFDAIALLGLAGSETAVALVLSAVTLALAVTGGWLLSKRLRRHPEPVAWVVTMGLAVTTAVSGMTVASIAVQSAGYLIVIPVLVSIIVPWRTITHVRWLLAYAVVAVSYFILDFDGSFTAEARGDLVVVLLVSLGASLAGHVLLQSSQILNFTSLERIRLLQRRVATDMFELEQAHHALELTARTDPLTGAGNRRRLDEDLRAVRAHIQRSGFSYGLIEIDLDRFKAINDILGHTAGDDVLRRVVGAIQASLRASDAVYRLGGEEFAVVLATPTFDGLAAACERLRVIVLELGIEHPANEPSGVVTISMGGTLVGAADLAESDDGWFERIDRALYVAKREGRNRVELVSRPDGVAEASRIAGLPLAPGASRGYAVDLGESAPRQRTRSRAESAWGGHGTGAPAPSPTTPGRWAPSEPRR